MMGSRSFATDTIRDWPDDTPIRCPFFPSDSKHGGRIWCQERITGFPELVQFEDPNDDGVKSAWISTSKEVWKDLKKNYQQSVVFTRERIDCWERFWKERWPWGGLMSLPDERRKPFAVRSCLSYHHSAWRERRH